MSVDQYLLMIPKSNRSRIPKLQKFFNYRPNSFIIESEYLTFQRKDRFLPKSTENVKY